MSAYWIGVASRDHVRLGVKGGFCQLGHGKEAPLRRLRRGDVIIYYSPRERMREGEPVQAFTAAGRIRDDAPYQVDAEQGFRPYRRNADFFRGHDAPIRPLLHLLSFTKGRDNWGRIFHRSAFEISSDDYRLIAQAMALEDS
jgi:hypothetical protein